MVFKFTFSGTTYNVAIAAGVGGWDLIAHNPEGAAEVEIQAAIDYVGALGGGLIFIQAGDYTITAQIDVLFDYLTIRGAGKSTVFFSPHTGISVFKVGDVGTDVYYPVFEDFKIDEPSPYYFDVGIEDVNSIHAQYDNLYLHRLLNGVLYNNDHGNFTMTRLYVRYCETGINITQTHDSIISNCMIDRFSVAGIYVALAENLFIVDSSSESIIPGIHGINAVQMRYSSIANCFFNESGTGIELQAACISVTILGNGISATTNTLVVAGELHIITSNIIRDSGITMAGPSHIFASNSLTDSNITVAGNGNSISQNSFSQVPNDNITVTGERAKIIGNEIYVAGFGGTGDGIVVSGEDYIISLNYIHGPLGNGINCSAGFGIISANTVWESLETGILVSSGVLVNVDDNHVGYAVQWGIKIETDRCSIGNNIVHHSDADDTTQYDGIYINGDRNLVSDNTCYNNDRYEVNIAGGTANIVLFNNLYGIDRVAAFNDAGTDTILPTISGEFPLSNLGGTATAVAPVINTSPGGIDIDAADEFAHVKVPLPTEIQQVVRIKIWAYSNVIEATNNMLLRIVAHGAGSSELWSGNAIDVADHPSVEEGAIVQYDVIHWVIDVGDDAQIGTLAAQDLLELLAIYNAASAPDIATDTLIAGYNIEYV